MMESYRAQQQRTPFVVRAAAVLPHLPGAPLLYAFAKPLTARWIAAPPPPPPPGTVAVYGPEYFITPNGSQTTFVEELGIVPVEGLRYQLKVENGKDGQPITDASITIGGRQLITTADISGTVNFHKDMLVTGRTR